MNPLRLALSLLLIPAMVSPQAGQQAASPGSIEGVVVKLGTNEPIAGADVELTRVEGTTAAPLPPGAAEVMARALVGAGNNAAIPPAAIASEIQYFKTGEDGKFVFRNLKEGKYRLVAVRIGGQYQPAEYGQRDPRGRGFNFPLTAGQAMTGARLEMAPTVVITGRVTDAAGLPVGHARVSALAAKVENGRRYLMVQQVTHTDDQGQYRLFWMSPGRYYVAARLEDLRRRGVALNIYPPGRIYGDEIASAPIVERRRMPSGEVEEETSGLVYYGGVLDADRARPLDIRPGATFAGADITLGIGKIRSWHIRGTVLDSTGKPAKDAGVRAIPRQSSPNVFVIVGTTDSEGNFDLPGAVPGSYALFATTAVANTAPVDLIARAAAIGVVANAGTTTTELGYLPVDVGTADVNGIKVSTISGVALEGSVGIEGRPLQGDPDIPKIVVSLQRDPNILTMPEAMIPLRGERGEPAPVNGQVRADGKFRIMAGLGDFRVNVANIPANSYVKSIRMGNTDVLSGGLQVNGPPDGPLEIVIGTDGGEINGTANTERGELMPNVIVAVVPESPLMRKRYDLYRSTATDFAGKFRVQNVPPGTYKLFAWEYVDADVWQDAQFLQLYETAGKVLTVREGSTQETQLRVTPVRR